MKQTIFATRTKVFLLGVFLVAGYALTAEAAPNNRDARRAALAANERFYIALNAMFVGNMAPMESVWSHADDITYLPPTGTQLRGWDAVQQSWQTQANKKLGGHVDSRNVRAVVLSPTLVLVTNTEIGENPHTGSGPMNVNIRSSKIYRLEAGEWKLIFDHVDILPELANDI